MLNEAKFLNDGEDHSFYIVFGSRFLTDNGTDFRVLDFRPMNTDPRNGYTFASQTGIGFLINTFNKFTPEQKGACRVVEITDSVSLKQIEFDNLVYEASEADLDYIINKAIMEEKIGNVTLSILKGHE